MDSSSRRQEQRILKALFRAVDSMRLIDATMPMQTFAAFLVIAQQEGMNVKEIGDRVGLPQSSASRNVSALSDWDWRKKTGLQLVTYSQDPMNLSTKLVSLSPKGRRLAE